ncbi:hypothetical protein AHAS_Ahas10G0122400 [Arachis hypogaea]
MQVILLFCRPLYASSLLAIIRTLLKQSRIDEIRILGYNTLVDFIECQRYAIPLKSICVEVNFGGKSGYPLAQKEKPEFFL